MNKTILVTGGAGYIGSHTVKELLSKGYHVVVYDNLDEGHRSSVPSGAVFVNGCLSDKRLVSETIKKYDIDSVMHFAAHSVVSESVSNPDKYYINNLVNGINLLNAMKENGVKNLVFSSTASVYGEPRSVSVKESDVTEPTNPYGHTKLMFEKILEQYDKTYGFKFISLRYFNAAGAHVSGEIGEDHKPETHLIPLVIDVALGKRDNLKIFGTDYDTKDGTCIRDYIHVTDLADAHVLALEALDKGKESTAYNLGNGNGYSVKEVIDMVKDVTGKEIPVENTSRRAGDPAVLVACSEKISEELGWSPKFGDLKEIVKTAWDWHSKNPDGYKDG